MVLGSRKRSRQTAVVIVTGSCCMPRVAPFDEQAQRVVEQAVSEAGVEARVKVVSAATAYMGGIPKVVMAQLMGDFNESGRIPLPLVLVNGEAVSSGVPSVEDVKAALRATAERKGKTK